MEDMRKQTKKQLAFALFSISIAIGFFIIPQVIAPATLYQNQVTIQQIESVQQKIPILTKNAPHLLIILSPQYTKDDAIIQSIHTYQQSILDQPHWTSELIFLTPQTNQISSIDTIIQTNTQQKNLTAILLIGEDITLPIKNTYQTINKPKLNTYSIINTSSNKQETICVSLLFPAPTATYQQKQTQIITTLNRFSTTRHLTLHNPSTIIEQASLTTYSKKDYIKLADTLQASYYQNIKSSQLISILHTPHDIICLHGHGTPHQIQLNTTSNLKLTSKMATSLQTSILAIDGCYTDSMYNSINDSHDPFISTICQSNTLHIGFFGLLSQQTTNQSSNVINTLLPSITNHSTIAEAINHAEIEFDFIFTGDPTIRINN